MRRDLDRDEEVVLTAIALSTLQRWQIDDRRRRKLWRELSKHGFDIAILVEKAIVEETPIELTVNPDWIPPLDRPFKLR